MTDNTLLQQKLEQYSVTVRGQTTTGRAAAELAGYAAAAGAAMAMAGAADAAIIYSGIQNITVAINPNAVATGDRFRSSQFTPIDINGGGPDIGVSVSFFGTYHDRLRHVPPSCPKYCWTYINTGNYSGRAGFVAMSGAQVILTTNGAANLPLSFIVGPGGVVAGAASFERFSGVRLITGIYYGNYTIANFPISVTGIAGVQLGSGDYGWIRLRLDDLGPNQPFGGIIYFMPLGIGLPDRVTIIDWAYDDSGAPIHVADTGVSQVPEPSSLALLAGGAAGLAAFRRRKAERRV